MLVLRIPPRRLLTLDDLEARDSVPAEPRAILTEALLAGRTLVIAGAVSSGKTALGSALLAHLLHVNPTERLVTIEEGARELQLPKRRNIARLLADEHNPARTLLRISLRLCPDRIIIGELRGGEAVEFVKSALSGHPGLATIHASSAPGAVARITDLLEEAGSPPSPARVARSVDLIAHMTRHRARRFVDEIVRLGEPDAHGNFAIESLYRAPDSARSA
jgi:type IV secretion system protein VirB11